MLNRCEGQGREAFACRAKAMKAFWMRGKVDSLHIHGVKTSRAFTVEMWFCLEADSTEEMALFGDDGYSTEEKGLICAVDEGNYLRFGFVSRQVKSEEPIVIRGEWSHICCTFSSMQELSLYFNGQLVAYAKDAGAHKMGYEVRTTQGSFATFFSQPFRSQTKDEMTLGRARSRMNLQGKITEFRFWQGTRSREQIADAWNRRLNSWEIRSPLVRYWSGTTSGALPVDKCTGSWYWVRASRMRYAADGPSLLYKCPSLSSLCQMALETAPRNQR